MFYEPRSPFLSMLRSHHMGSLLSCGLHQGGHFMEICIIGAWRTGEHLLNWLLNQICKFYFAVSTSGIVVKYWGNIEDSCCSILQGNFLCLITKKIKTNFVLFIAFQFYVNVMSNLWAHFSLYDWTVFVTAQCQCF